MLILVATACEVSNPPGVVGDAGADDEVTDAGLPPDAGLRPDGGPFQITDPRDAGPIITDHGLPWTWAAVKQVLSIPPSGGGVTGRWNPVHPLAVDRAWAGGVLLLDGNVVGIPFNESSVLVIHPDTRITERWPLQGGAVAEGWHGGVLLPDGTVIGIPRNASRFLRIDPATRSAAPFGDDLSDTGADGGLDKFHGGVLGLNGLVYAAPATANFIARLDPKTGAVTRLPLPPTVQRGATQGAVLFPTGDIVMFPLVDRPGLLVIPARGGGEDEVWLLPRPRTTGAPAFTGGGVITGIDSAIAPPQQNAMPLRYEAGVFSWAPPLPGVSAVSANAWFFGAWSTNGHIYTPPFGATDALTFSLDGSATLVPFETGDAQFRSVSGAVALPDGRIIGLPHGRSSYLELTPEGRRTLPPEAFTSPFLNKL